jgi:hypothetical protein
MVTFAALSAVSIVIALYASMGAWVYRRPWVLLVAGLVAAGFAVLMKATFLSLKAVPPPHPWTIEALDIAASVVDPTLVGLAGGLIASAFIAKLQILHARELCAAEEAVSRARELVDHVHRSDDDLKAVAMSLSNEEFRIRLQAVRAAKVHALWSKDETESKLRELNEHDLN